MIYGIYIPVALGYISERGIQQVLPPHGVYIPTLFGYISEIRNISHMSGSLPIKSLPELLLKLDWKGQIKDTPKAVVTISTKEEIIKKTIEAVKKDKMSSVVIHKVDDKTQQERIYLF